MEVVDLEMVVFTIPGRAYFCSKGTRMGTSMSKGNNIPENLRGVLRGCRADNFVLVYMNLPLFYT